MKVLQVALAIAAPFSALSLSPKLAPVITVDPGHPSEVGVGTRGKKLTELRENWKIALMLARKLKKDGYTVVLTKSRENEYVTNERRAEIANEAGSSLMVRLHCDAAPDSGFAVYFPDAQGKSHGVVGPSRRVVAESKKAAVAFHGAMKKALHGLLHDRGLMTDRQTAVGAKQGALTGSVFSKVPVLLVEMVVLTNPRDEAFIGSRNGETAMVRALELGVLTAVPKPSHRARHALRDG